THTARSAGQRPAGDAGIDAHHLRGEGEQMTEGGMLSIVRRGTPYQVRYASPNPHDMNRQPYPCPDEGTLVALLPQCELEAGLSIERSRNCSMGGWLCCPLSSLRHTGSCTSRALRRAPHVCADGLRHSLPSAVQWLGEGSYQQPRSVICKVSR